VSGPRLRPIVLAAAVLAYASLVHYSNRDAAPAALGAVLAVAPLLALLALWLWRAPARAVLLPLALAAAGALLWLLWSPIERHFDWIYLWQQCAACAALGLAFGRTLLPGQVPLCTRWATVVHGSLPDDARRYTRAVTAVWTSFFGAVILLSVALYLLAPRSLWSLFSNFLILPLAVLLFAGEYLLRRRRLPQMQRASLAQMARLYLAEPPTVTSGRTPPV
jgi:uncharacterized membrane protein